MFYKYLLSMKIIENFVNEEFEKLVLNLIPKKGREKDTRNNILRYGNRKTIGDSFISENIPNFFLSIKDFEFDSVSINEYKTGQKIDWHIDMVHNGPIIHIISLINEGTLKFKKGEETKEFLLPRYSLGVMEGELRNEWHHSFIAEKPRVSVVFRKYPFKK